MAYTVRISSTAERSIKKLPRDVQARIFAGLETLKSDPRGRGVIKMKQYQDTYRLRIGDYRVVYQLKIQRADTYEDQDLIFCTG